MVSNEGLIKSIQEFDPSDDYHNNENDHVINYDDAAAGYYAAIDRVIRLLRGEIKDWKDV